MKPELRPTGMKNISCMLGQQAEKQTFSIIVRKYPSFSLPHIDWAWSFGLPLIDAL
ncbi:MAG: hypothetical protein MESAZ_00444 [Saezia sanguinis]